MYPLGEALVRICFSSVCKTPGTVSFFNAAIFSSYSKIFSYSYIHNYHYVTKFWKTYHLHTNEIIRIPNFAPLQFFSHRPTEFVSAMILVIECIPSNIYNIIHLKLQFILSEIHVANYFMCPLCADGRFLQIQSHILHN